MHTQEIPEAFGGLPKTDNVVRLCVLWGLKLEYRYALVLIIKYWKDCLMLAISLISSVSRIYISFQ